MAKRIGPPGERPNGQRRVGATANVLGAGMPEKRKAEENNRDTPIHEQGPQTRRWVSSSRGYGHCRPGSFRSKLIGLHGVDSLANRLPPGQAGRDARRRHSHRVVLTRGERLGYNRKGGFKRPRWRRVAETLGDGPLVSGHPSSQSCLSSTLEERKKVGQRLHQHGPRGRPQGGGHRLGVRIHQGDFDPISGVYGSDQEERPA